MTEKTFSMPIDTPQSRSPKLTDRAALLKYRARATKGGLNADFLHQEAIDEVQWRLDTVNRTFTAPAIVTGFPSLWDKAIPGARLVPDSDLLDLTPGAHDVVVHAMALHWAEDPVGQMVQARHALKADGLFLALFFAGQTLNELRTSLAEAEAEVTGGLSPRVLPMGDIRDLGGLLQRAGYALPVADGFTRKVAYRDMFHLMADLRAMGESNALISRLKRPTRRAVMLRAAQIYAQNYATPEGLIEATFEIICLTGWSPHESQQQPLRPGSARARLADALNAVENPLPRDPLHG